jgi:hypothetical protein
MMYVWLREFSGSLDVAWHVGRLEFLDADLHVVGVMVVLGWKRCEPIYCRGKGWLHLYPTGLFSDAV